MDTGIEQDYSPPTELSLQEKVIGTGMLYHTNTTTQYQLDASGNRVHNTRFLSGEFDALAQEFAQDPMLCLAHGRENVRGIIYDTKLPEAKRKARVKRYTDAYLGLTLKLDHQAFPPDERLHQGIPDYIPDGLTDMGSDAKLDPQSRGREKIRVDKQEILDRARPFITGVFLTRHEPSFTKEQWKLWVTQQVGRYVYESMPYNVHKRPHPAQVFRSVGLHEMIDHNLSVCRHHALETQVLLQTFGITSRLMKSDVSFEGQSGAHANNLVRANGNWYLLDTTSPEKRADGTRSVFIKRVPERSIDLNTQKYHWSFTEDDGRIRSYDTRNNMYYRVRDNSVDE